MRSASANRAGIYRRREHILDGRRGPGRLRAVLTSFAELAHADGDSIITDLLADDVIRWADICRPRP